MMTEGEGWAVKSHGTTSLPYHQCLADHGASEVMHK